MAAAVFWTSLEFVLRPGPPTMGMDFEFDRVLAERWLATGALFNPHQLSGPYDVTPMVDPLYPPVALFLFVPFVVLPAILWWAIPLAIVVHVIAWLRPGRWFWPLCALALAWPRTQTAILFGDTDIWVSAAIGAGIRWGWPLALLVIKPSFVPFMLLGLGRRSFWIATVVLLVASLPMLPLWIDYARAMLNTSVPLTYSLTAMPLAALCFVAWLFETRQPEPQPLAARGVA